MTGVALTILQLRRGRARCCPLHTNFVVSSTPSVPVDDARDPSAPRATSAYGLSSSFQVRTSARAAAKRSERDLLPRAILFERRADEERLALHRDDAGEQPLAAAPADVREVDERGATRRGSRASIFALGHQPSGLLDPRRAARRS